MNTIDDMQNEKDCLNYYNVFENIRDFEKLDSNECLYEKDYYEITL